MKKKCIITPQYKDSITRDVKFPNIDNYGNELTDKYYDDLYCSWDGFECHNSIPCKKAQNTL